MQESACPYGKCDGTGLIYEEATNTGSQCQCVFDRIKRQRVSSVFSPIPPRYRDVAIDRNPLASLPAGVKMDIERYAGNVDTHIDAGEGFWLIGPSRLGKTSAAAYIAKAAIEAGYVPVFKPVSRLLMEIRNSFRDNAEVSELQIHDQLVDADLLVLDDLAAVQMTPWVKSTIYTIVNSRLNEERAIVVTSDVRPTSLCEPFGERTVNRLLEICGRPVTLEPPVLKAVGE